MLDGLCEGSTLGPLDPVLLGMFDGLELGDAEGIVLGPVLVTEEGI